MLLNTLLFLTGVSLVQLLTSLPGFGVMVCLTIIFVLSVVATWYTRQLALRLLFQHAGFLLAGTLWAVFQAQTYLNHRLPESLSGQDIHVEGVIVDIPRQMDQVQRFIFKVDTFGGTHRTQLFPKKLKLSWYYGEKLNAGERWHFLVRLKPPHGFFNPGGFDYEGWLYQHRIHATGYIRKSEQNQKIG